MTIVKSGNRIKKKIPWSAARLSSKDWDRVADIRDILAVHSRSCFIHLIFSLTLTPAFIRTQMTSSKLFRQAPSHPCGGFFR